LATYWFLQNPNRPTMQSRFFKIVVVETELWFLLLLPLLLERDTFSPFENAGDSNKAISTYDEVINKYPESLEITNARKFKARLEALAAN
jgi:hypothetical protein